MCPQVNTCLRKVKTQLFKAKLVTGLASEEVLHLLYLAPVHLQNVKLNFLSLTKH